MEGSQHIGLRFEEVRFTSLVVVRSNKYRSTERTSKYIYEGTRTIKVQTK